MLKQRVLTALILGPLVIWGIFALPTNLFNLILGGIIGLGAWEWARLGGLSQPVSRLLYAGLVLLILYVLSVLPQSDIIMKLVFTVVLLWWLAVIVNLVSYRQREIPAKVSTLPTLFAGLPVLIGVYFALVLLRQDDNYGPAWIMMLMLLIWIADSAAYFVGRRFGRNKLLVSVSPGKSWEGVWGALLASLLIGVVAAVYFQRTDHLLTLVIISLVTVMVSIVGDLNESYFKRRAGVKDSSQLLPGHGGILDRIDSLTSAAPVFYAGLVVFGV